MFRRLLHCTPRCPKSFDDVMKFMRKTSLGPSDSLKEKTEWLKQKEALAKKFKGERWNPNKKLSRVQMESVRLLKRQFPNMNAGDLSQQFKVSPEAIRRILKSRWTPTEKEAQRFEQRRLERREKNKHIYTTTNNIEQNENAIPKVIIYERANFKPKGYFNKRNKYNGDNKPRQNKSRRKLDLLKSNDN